MSKTSHLGKKTAEVLAQEIFSILNTKPMFRKSNWKDEYVRLSKELLALGYSNWRNVYDPTFRPGKETYDKFEGED